MRKIMIGFVLIAAITFVFNNRFVQAEGNDAALEQIQHQIEQMERTISAQQNQIRGLKSILEKQTETSSSTANELETFTRENIDQAVNDKIVKYFENEHNIDKIVKNLIRQIYL